MRKHGSAPRSGCRVSSFIFPHSALAFAEPFDGGRDALVASGVLLRFRNPFEIIALGRGRETVEHLFRFRSSGESGCEFRMQRRSGLRRMFWLARRRDGSRQFGRLADQGIELIVWREVAERGQPAELAHSVGIGLVAGYAALVEFAFVVPVL